MSDKQKRKEYDNLLQDNNADAKASYNNYNSEQDSPPAAAAGASADANQNARPHFNSNFDDKYYERENARADANRRDAEESYREDLKQEEEKRQQNIKAKFEKFKAEFAKFSQPKTPNDLYFLVLPDYRNNRYFISEDQKPEVIINETFDAYKKNKDQPTLVSSIFVFHSADELLKHLEELLLRGMTLDIILFKAQTPHAIIKNKKNEEEIRWNCDLKANEIQHVIVINAEKERYSIYQNKQFNIADAKHALPLTNEVESEFYKIARDAITNLEKYRESLWIAAEKETDKIYEGKKSFDSRSLEMCARIFAEEGHSDLARKLEIIRQTDQLLSSLTLITQPSNSGGHKFLFDTLKNFQIELAKKVKPLNGSEATTLNFIKGPFNIRTLFSKSEGEKCVEDLQKTMQQFETIKAKLLKPTPLSAAKK